MSMPLEGIRVLDWTIWMIGSTSTAMLGSLGAEVIKIENKEGGDPNRNVRFVRRIPAKFDPGHSFYHETLNRNKKSLAIDLKKPGAREVIYRLVAKSDVFVQNFRKGVAQRLGMDYKTLSQYNPRLIYANVSGFGPEGPDADRPAMDLCGTAQAGFNATAGDPGLPPQQVGGGIGDATAAIFGAYAVLAALVARERLGIGQEVDASMLGGLIALQELPVAVTYGSGKEWPRVGHFEAFNPLWNWYPCKDGKWITFAMLQPDPWWPAFCRAMGAEHLENDPKFKDMEVRAKHSKELIAILDKIFATRTRDEWMQILEKEDLIYAPINTIGDLREDPQVMANEYLTDFYHPVLKRTVTFSGLPIRLSKTPAVAVRSRAPELGEHTEEVLIEVGGYSWEDIAILGDKGVI